MPTIKVAVPQYVWKKLKYQKAVFLFAVVYSTSDSAMIHEKIHFYWKPNICELQCFRLKAWTLYLPRLFIIHIKNTNSAIKCWAIKTLSILEALFLVFSFKLVPIDYFMLINVLLRTILRALHAAVVRLWLWSRPCTSFFVRNWGWNYGNCIA